MITIGPHDTLPQLEPCFDSLIADLAAQSPLRPALLKAQIAAESGFNPLAQSPTGPVGLTQFTRSTWLDVMPDVHPDKRTDVRYAIMAQVRYMSRLLNWANGFAPRAEQEAFALAAYNAGQGSIGKCREHAFHQGKHSDLWSEVQPSLLSVLGPSKAQETAGYVERILRLAEKYQVAV